MNFLFPADYRIRQTREFEQAFRGKRSANKWFTIHRRENHFKFARLGMVISKRIIATSVNRNYAKRLIRETFRLNFSNLPSCDFVVRIRRILPKKASAEAREALLQLILIQENCD